MKFKLETREKEREGETPVLIITEIEIASCSRYFIARDTHILFSLLLFLSSFSLTHIFVTDKYNVM